MFWNTKDPHGLPHDPFKSCVVPRPIGWISSLNSDGQVNLAPYSFFNAVGGEPPMVMFSSTGVAPRATKDTLMNIEETGEFVCNMATHVKIEEKKEERKINPLKASKRAARR